MATIKKSKAKNLSAGPSKKQPKAGLVDPMGQYTKVQKRTLGSMKTGGTIKKAQKGIRVAPGAHTAPGMKMKFGESRKNYEKRLADAKSSYEGSTAPKVEYAVPTAAQRKVPGGYRTGPTGGQTVSVDTVGMAAGNRSFPAKVTKNGKTAYYPINRGRAKDAVKFSQKNGGKTMKKK